jgi:hypothetical protein
MIRALIWLTLVIGLGWWMDREHQAGRFQRVDERFLDFLVANARDRFEGADPEADTPSPVVFVRMNAADQAEYAGWPPRPLDWQMVLKGLQRFDPALVVIPETLNWGSPSPEFTREAAEVLISFPSVVLGVEAQLAPEANTPAFLGGLEDSLPPFEKVGGPIQAIPALGALITAPDEALRRLAEIGIAIVRKEDDQSLLPYALREQDRLLPSVLAQALTRASGTPYATHRLVLGPGAGAYLANGAFVPLTQTGEFLVNTRQAVPVVDALNLMTAEIVGALTDEDKRHLMGPGKVLVIGTDGGAGGNLSLLHAQALGQALSTPRIQILPTYAQWVVWALACGAGCWLVFRVPRAKALLRGLGCIFAGLVVCFLAFLSALIWCPPTLPAAVIAMSALFARVAGRVKSPASAPVPETA